MSWATGPAPPRPPAAARDGRRKRSVPGRAHGRVIANLRCAIGVGDERARVGIRGPKELVCPLHAFRPQIRLEKSTVSKQLIIDASLAPLRTATSRL